jgi:hypothetical protein
MAPSGLPGKWTIANVNRGVGLDGFAGFFEKLGYK